MIAAGIATFEIARVMGRSVHMIEKTYGHLLPDAIDRARLALDAWEARAAAAAEGKAGDWAAPWRPARFACKSAGARGAGA